MMMSEIPSNTAQSQQVFCLEGEYWTVQYADVVCRLKDGKGMRYLAALLARPGEPVGVNDLANDAVGSARASVVPAMRSVRRSAGSAHALELARVNVTRAIKTALRRIALHHPALAAHLLATVRTGVLCLYLPDPRLQIHWELGPARQEPADSVSPLSR